MNNNCTTRMENNISDKKKHLLTYSVLSHDVLFYIMLFVCAIFIVLALLVYAKVYNKSQSVLGATTSATSITPSLSVKDTPLQDTKSTKKYILCPNSPGVMEHCYAEVNFQTTYPIFEDKTTITPQNLIVYKVNQNNHFSQETWINDKQGNFWIEAGYGSGYAALIGDQSLNHFSKAHVLINNNVFFADFRQHSGYHFHPGPRIAKNDFGKDITVDINNVNVNTWRIKIDGNHIHFKGNSNNNDLETFIKKEGSEIDLGEEFVGGGNITTSKFVSFSNNMFRKNNEMLYIENSKKYGKIMYTKNPPTWVRWKNGKEPTQTNHGGVIETGITQ